MKQTWPYQNLSLDSMDGEEWLDIPGYDGYLLVSNYGRIWSLPRPVETKTGYFYYTKELIRKQGVLRRYNPFIKDYREQLYVRLYYLGTVWNASVNRLVYSLFVKEINFEEDGLLIVHKDGINVNNRWDNLEAMDHSELYGHDLKLKFKPKTFKRLIKTLPSRINPIVKYSLDGKIVDEYESVIQAANTNGVHRSNIRLCAIGKLRYLDGFVYRYKEQPYKGEFQNLDVSTTKSVVQYSKNVL